MGPLEKFFGKDSDDLTKPLRESGSREDLFLNLEEDLNDLEQLDHNVLRQRLDDMKSIKAEIQILGWQSEDPIETNRNKELVDRLNALIVSAEGN